MSRAILHMAGTLPPINHRRNETRTCGTTPTGKGDSMEAPLSRFRTGQADDFHRRNPQGYGPLYVKGEASGSK